MVIGGFSEKEIERLESLRGKVATNGDLLLKRTVSPQRLEFGRYLIKLKLQAGEQNTDSTNPSRRQPIPTSDVAKETAEKLITDVFGEKQG